MGSSKSVTVSYWYALIAHLGLCQGPIDALRAIRGGDREAWKGNLRESAQFYVDKPDLYGGEKSEGGIQGTFELMMGESDQEPNAYLAQHFGAAQPGYRGRATILLRGPKIGAGNPYPKPLYFCLERILKGWEDDNCWYPPKAPVPIKEWVVGEGTDGGGGDAGVSRWLFQLSASSYWAQSPDGRDWTNPDRLVGSWDSAFGAYPLGDGNITWYHSSGNVLNSFWTTPTSTTLVDEVGYVPFYLTGAAINGSSWLAKHGVGVYYSDNPVGEFTQVGDAATFVFGSETYVTRYNSSDHTFKYATQVEARAGNWTDGTTLERSPDSSDAEYQWYTSSFGANETVSAVCGADYHAGGFVWWSADGFATKSRATLPANTSAVQSLLPVGGSNWVAFLPEPLDGHAGVLFSGDNCATFVECPSTVGYSFSGSADRDDRDGLVLAVITNDAGGLLGSEDGFDWFPVDHNAPYPPSVIMCVAPQSEGGGPTEPDFDGLYAMNPAHVLFDSLTARREHGGMEEPVARINLDSFVKAADRLYDERFGICCTWGGDESAETFQQRICNLAGASLSQSLKDGQYYLDLLREVEDPDSLPALTDDDIADWEAEPTVPSEAINQVQVKWFDPYTREERITPPVQSLGAIAEAGGLYGDIRTYFEIPYENLALRVAQRDLTALSSALWKFTLIVNRKMYDLRKGQQIRLLCPLRGFADMIVVIGDIDYGSLDEPDMKLVLLQDVFSLPNAAFVAPQGSLNPAEPTTPTSVLEAVVMEAPYAELAAVFPPSEIGLLSDDGGYVLAGAAKPATGSSFSLATKPAGGQYEVVDSQAWTPAATIVDADTFGIDNDTGLGTVFAYDSDYLLERVTVGSWAVWGSEIVRVDDINEVDKKLTFGRACLDTVPHTHAAGSRIYFVGNWYAFDTTEYASGETVYAKILNRTTQQQQSIEAGTEFSVDMAHRQFRPYPTANLKINDLPFYGEHNLEPQESVPTPPGTPGGGSGGGGGPAPGGGGGGGEETGELFDLVGTPYGGYEDVYYVLYPGDAGFAVTGGYWDAAAFGGVVDGVPAAAADVPLSVSFIASGWPQVTGDQDCDIFFSASSPYPGGTTADYPGNVDGVVKLEETINWLPKPDYAPRDMRLRNRFADRVVAGGAPGEIVQMTGASSAFGCLAAELNATPGGVEKVKFEVEIAGATNPIAIGVSAQSGAFSPQSSTFGLSTVSPDCAALAVYDGVYLVQLDRVSGQVDVLDSDGDSIFTAVLPLPSGRLYHLGYNSEYVQTATIRLNGGNSPFTVTSDVGYVGVPYVAPAIPPVFTYSVPKQGSAYWVSPWGDSCSGTNVTSGRPYISYASHPKSSGKWRVRLGSARGDCRIGLTKSGFSDTGVVGTSADSVGWDGQKLHWNFGGSSGVSGNLTGTPSSVVFASDFDGHVLRVYDSTGETLLFAVPTAIPAGAWAITVSNAMDVTVEVALNAPAGFENWRK